MHVFDIIILIVLGVYVLLGIKRGFIEEIFHLLAMLGGFIGAYLSYPLIFSQLHFLKTSQQAKTIVSFVLAYIIIALVLLVTGWLLKKVVHLTPLGLIDRIVGGSIGFLKAFIFIWIFVLSVTLLPSSTLKKSFTASFTYRLIDRIPMQLKVPHSGSLKKSYKKLKKSIPLDKINKTKKNIDQLRSVMESLEEETDSIMTGI